MSEIILILVTFFNILLGIFILTQNIHSTNNRLFSLLSFVAALWTFVHYMWATQLSVFWFNSAFAAGSLLIAVGLIWILNLTEKRLAKYKVILIIFAGVLFSICSYLPGFTQGHYDSTLSSTVITTTPGWGLSLYMLYYIFMALSILWKLGFAYKKSSDLEAKYQFRLIFTGALVTLLTTAFSTFIFSFIFNISVFGIDGIGFLFFLLYIAYSITRHNLFNIRILTIEIVTLIMWVVIIIRIFLADSPRELSFEISILLITIIVGILLIRSVLKEIKQREEIEHLAADLKIANEKLTELNTTLESKVAEQTREISHAYELEKKARRDLEKLNETKDQFIMITQHHLRTPVTSIRWGLESIINGAYGKVTKKMKVALDNTNIAVSRLTRIVDDFLSITAIKVGGQILDIKPASIYPLLVDVIHELNMEISNMNIDIKYSNDEKSWPAIPIDSSKIREVLLIVVENSIRYNIKNGRVDISTHIDNDIFEMVFKNTGIGFSPEESGRLFGSLFYRSEKARLAHPIGMGIGLSVSKAVVKAHKGTIEISSPGFGEGAQVVIRIPMSRQVYITD